MTTPLTVLSEEEQLLADSIYDFAVEQVRPLSREMDEKAQMDPGLIKRFFDMGIMGIEIPTEYGGSGSSFFMAILAVEALSRVDASAAIVVDVQNTLVINAFVRWASEDLKTRYLPKLATEWVGSYALSEAGSGSDAFGLACRATKAEGGWVLNGRKLWITSGKESSVFIIFANVNPDAGYKGITAFVVERGFEGFTIGKSEDKLGIRASSTTELLLDDCFVSDANVMGPVGEGYKAAIETLNEGRIGIGAQMIGIARGALDGAVAYAKEREQFGRPIASNQGMQFYLAEMAMDLEAARLLVYNAARLRDMNRPFAREAAMAKLFASNVAERIASQALEVYGGNGFSKEYPAEKFYRDAKIGKIYEGTSFMQLHTIAKDLLS